MDKINPASVNPIDAKLSELNKQFPEVFTENMIDIEKLKSLIDQDAIASPDRYVLGWAGKQNVFRAGKQDLGGIGLGVGID